MDRYGGIKKGLAPNALGIKGDLTGEVGVVAISSKLKVGNIQIRNYGPLIGGIPENFARSLNTE